MARARARRVDGAERGGRGVSRGARGEAGRGAGRGARSAAGPVAREKTPGRPGLRARPWHVAAAAAALAIAVHLPSLGNGFVRDDRELLAGRAALADPARLPALAASDFWAWRGAASGWWRPVPLVTFAAQAQAGAGARGLHAANVAMHAGATAALGAVLVHAGLPLWAALAGAAWFATLPAHAESVAWISGRTDLLCALFALLALALDRRARRRGHAWAGAGALGAFALALLSKEAAAALAAVVLAADLADRAGTPGAGARTLRWMVPYALLTAVWLVAHRVIARPVTELPGYLDPATRAQWPWAAWTMIPQAFAFFLPGVPIAPDQLPVIPAGPLDPRALGGLAVSLAALGGAVALAWRRSPLAAPAALVVAPLLPSIAVATAGSALAFGPRAAYLPSAGAAWLLAAGLARAGAAGGAARTRAVVVAGALALLGAAGSLALQTAWRDDAAYFERMVAAQPSNPAGWVGLGDLRAAAGDRAAADSLLGRAGALAPRLPALWVARAALHHRHGEWEASLSAADSALALAPLGADARRLRATALLRLRRTAEARAEAGRLLERRPGDAEALSVLGQALLLEDDVPGARRALEAATVRRPQDAAAWFALGRARHRSGDVAGAARALEAVVTLDRGYYDGWLQLAALRAEAGNVEGARAAAARAGALPEAADGRAAELARMIESGAGSGLPGARRSSTVTR